MQLTADLDHTVGAQYQLGPQNHVSAELLPHADVDAEFLPQFPRQRVDLGFPVGHFAAGQLPQSGQLRRAVPLRHQQLPVDDQGACDDDPGGHGPRRYTVEDMAVLTNDEVDAAVQELDGWVRRDGAIRRSVEFPAFLDGIDAVRRVAEHAEAQDHHPDIDIRWRTVTFALVTHSEGGVTEKDVAMARDIDGLVSGP